MSKKFLVTILIVLSIVTGLWIWTLASPRNIINIGGSASVDPLMQRLSNKYRGSASSFIYSSTGSNTGISNLKSQVYDIAFISKAIPDKEFPDIEELTSDVFSSKIRQNAIVDDAEFKQAISKLDYGYKFINFANEPIVFIYNTEKTGFDNSWVEKLTFELETNSKNPKLNSLATEILKKIYVHDNQNDLFTWQKLARELNPNDNSWKKVADTPIFPYSSGPGSGTWSSFEKISGGVRPGEAVRKYGNNGSVFYQVSHSPGAFGFVSLAYARAIKNNPKMKDMKTVIIKKNDKKWDIANDDQTNQMDYPLTRPFNAIFNFKGDSKNFDSILKFILWFCTNQTQAKDIYAEEGLSQKIVWDISNSQIATTKIFEWNSFISLPGYINEKHKNC